MEFRPLGRYDGKGRFVILGPAIEKGWKLKAGDVRTAVTRSENLKGDASHARLHQFDDEEDVEETEE